MSPPVVVDGDGKPVQVALLPKENREDVPIFQDGKKVAGRPQPDHEQSWPDLELSVGPGQSIELNTVSVALARRASKGRPIGRRRG